MSSSAAASATCFRPSTGCRSVVNEEWDQFRYGESKMTSRGTGACHSARNCTGRQTMSGSTPAEERVGKLTALCVTRPKKKAEVIPRSLFPRRGRSACGKFIWTRHSERTNRSPKPPQFMPCSPVECSAVCQLELLWTTPACPLTVIGYKVRFSFPLEHLQSGSQISVYAPPASGQRQVHTSACIFR